MKPIRAIVAFLLLCSLPVTAQETTGVTLEEATLMALQNNHLLRVRKYQADEKKQKMAEDRIKFFPVVAAAGNYQYNSNLPSLTLSQGSFGQIPLGAALIQFPPVDYRLEMGKHDIYNAGVQYYQPLSQLPEINTGLKISAVDYQIASIEEKKAEQLLKSSVEKLFYGMLIVGKQVEEAELRFEMANARLDEIATAVASGKAMESNRLGLEASAASEKQNILKLKMQYDDLADDLQHVTGSRQKIEPAELSTNNNDYFVNQADTAFHGIENNNDLKIAALTSEKARLSVRAGKYSYLPDIGLTGGYTYQDGNLLYPANNTFFGASVKWNLQDLLLNRTIIRQRTFARQQAEENLANAKEQLSIDLGKSLRKLSQSAELIKVSALVVKYRNEELRLQEEKKNNGLCLYSELLSARAAMAKAESDYFSAKLNYRIAMSDLLIITGSY